MESVQGWIEKHLRLQVNAAKSGVGSTWLGAWHLAGTGSLQTALSNATLRRYGFLMPSDLAGC
jgi:hypothetical protein